MDVRKLHKARIAAVGSKTSEALAQRGLIAEVQPERFQGEALGEAMAGLIKPGQKKALLATGDLAGGGLPRMLSEMGLEVTEIDVYENVLSAEYGDETIELLRRGAIDIITFTSSSTVKKNLFEALRLSGAEDPAKLMASAEFACIGPKTAATAREFGLPVNYMAQEATVASLVRAIIQPKEEKKR